VQTTAGELIPLALGLGTHQTGDYTWPRANQHQTPQIHATTTPGKTLASDI
jgi:hypothetical protein